MIKDTIKNNITLTSKSKANIEDILKVTSLTDVIHSNSEGLDTLINENSANLSGGQKQRISIAKALYKKPDVLVLDEPSSALDTVSKIKFLSFLENYKNDRIIIIITHDSEFVNIADHIIDFNKLNIKESSNA